MRRLIVFILIIILLSSCHYYSGKNGGRGSNYGSLNDPQTQEGPRAYGSQKRGNALTHNNTQLAYSQDLSNKVAGLNGVHTAIAMQTDHNVYVAVMIDNTATGTRGPGSRNETNHTGTGWGAYNPYTLEQAIDSRQLATGMNSYETVQNPVDLSPAFKQKIAVTIRLENPKVMDVFISANRDFINLLNTYFIESAQGKSLQSHVGEFNAVVNQHFSIPDTLIEP